MITIQLMGRILSIIGNTLFILLLVGIILFFTRTYVANAILSHKLGVPVRIKQINVVPGKISVKDAKLKNASGYAQPYALRIGNTQINAPLRNLFRSEIVIDSIEVSNILLTLELTNRNTSINNWTALLSEIQNEEPKMNSQGTNRHAVIRKLVLSNLTVRIFKSATSYQDKVIRRLEFTDVTTADGDLTRRIMQAIIYELIFNIRNILKLPLQVTQDTLQGVFRKMDSLQVPFFRRNN